MKPRLDPVPLTPEDRFILRRLKLGLPFHHLWQGADRRDADLMLALGSGRDVGAFRWTPDFCSPILRRPRHKQPRVT